MTAPHDALHDALIIGGSYAGLAAATQLARARRRVLVVDQGRPRNRFASHAHGFLGQDGRPGADILCDARAQLSAYATADIRQGEATTITRVDQGFSVRLGDGAELKARRLVLAHGVEDQMPDIPGVAERWGRTALHCPWCHGHEIGGGAIGVLGRDEHAVHYAAVVAEWGKATLFLAPDAPLSAEHARLLQRRGVAVERTPVVALEGDAPALSGARLEDGRLIPMKAFFVGAHVRAGGPALQLGCEMTDTPLGRIVRVDAEQKTSQAGVFAAGDLSRAASNITYAVADGMTAAHALFRSLLEEETG